MNKDVLRQSTVYLINRMGEGFIAMSYQSDQIAELFISLGMRGHICIIYPSLWIYCFLIDEWL